ncbi:MAG: hypothetical protein UY63_C0001G0008 [Parcubacteria group bacterium GW2011_GWA2_51_10]|nr:MAG: hypothetical protein UY63_C0001G0008 [Parcubacteria group bacterium GW2011_GWA2_51_10]
MYGAAIAAPVALMPQVWTLYSQKNASGLALPTWVALGLINILWVLYSFAHREPPLGIANALFAMLNFSIVAGILIYG